MNPQILRDHWTIIRHLVNLEAGDDFDEENLTYTFCSMYNCTSTADSLSSENEGLIIQCLELLDGFEEQFKRRKLHVSEESYPSAINGEGSN